MKNYHEQYLFEDHSTAIKLIRVLRYLIFTGIVIFFYRRNVLGILLGVCFFALTFIYSYSSLVEYEYDLVENYFYIYKIISESKRILVGSINVKEIINVKKVNEYTDLKGAVKCYGGNREKYSILLITAKEKNKGRRFIVALDSSMLEKLKKINLGEFFFF